MTRALPPRLFYRIALLALTTLACPIARAADTGISPDALLRHIQVLSSDAFEGRAPGTPGEQRAVDYLVEQFKRFGLKPGNPDGTYVQDVPMVGFTARPTVSFAARDQRIEFHFPNDAVVWSRRFEPHVS